MDNILQVIEKKIDSIINKFEKETDIVLTYVGIGHKDEIILWFKTIKLGYLEFSCYPPVEQLPKGINFNVNKIESKLYLIIKEVTQLKNYILDIKIKDLAIYISILGKVVSDDYEKVLRATTKAGIHIWGNDLEQLEMRVNDNSYTLKLRTFAIPDETDEKVDVLVKTPKEITGLILQKGFKKIRYIDYREYKEYLV